MYSPLSQFDVVTIIPLYIFNVVDLTLTNVGLYGFFFLIILDLFFSSYMRMYKIYPGNIQVILESIFVFIYNLILQQIGKRGIIYMPLFLILFLFILSLNLISLLPYSYGAITSYFLFTIYFSTSLCLGIFLIGLKNYKMEFFKIFLPKVPLVLIPLMVIIEILSYILRSFSLAIRLSANLMAGHTLMHILGQVAVTLYMKYDFVIILYILLIFLFILEMGIAFLQAYVFVLLLMLYLNDAINLSDH